MVLGRSPQAQFRVDDSRVSRSHARVDWHGGSFQLTDLSMRRRLESPLLAGRDSCREASALLTEAHAKAASALARIN